jgi:hypothetical protein
MLRQDSELHNDCNLEPAEIARRVRQIAHDLHQTLRSTNSDHAELMELERRIDQLRVHTHGTCMVAIDRWLDNSRSVIRARVDGEHTPLKEIYTPTRHSSHYVTT